MKKVYIIFVFSFSLVSNLSAQIADSSQLSFTGCIDAYYAYYTDSLGQNNFQQFPSVSPRSNQFGLNTIMFTADYVSQNVRATTSIHLGDIANSSWSSTYNHIMEAHAGFKLCKKVWLDAGIFRTHVGTEGLLPKENIASSISVGTYYEPYYESGIRFNYAANNDLTLNLFVLNGYNLIEDNNHKKSLGLLVNYKVDDRINIGYSNYTGDDSPIADTASHLRIHNCAFVNYQSYKFKAQIGGDFCFQQNVMTLNGNSNSPNATMMSGVLSLKYACGHHISIYARGEMFNDPEGFMSMLFTDSLNNQTGLNINGITAGVEIQPTENSYIRIESRELMAAEEQELFYWNADFSNKRFEYMINFGLSF